LATSLPLVPSQRPHRGHTRKLLGDREFLLEGGCSCIARRGAPWLAHGVRKHKVVVGPAILSLKRGRLGRRKPAAAASALDAAV
jgi:hypothetical protein